MGCCESGCLKGGHSEDGSRYWGSNRDSADFQSDLHTVSFSADDANSEEVLFEKLRAMEGWGDGRRAPSDGSNASEPGGGSNGGPSIAYLVLETKAKAACRSHEIDQAELDALNQPPPKKTLNFVRWWVAHVVEDLHRTDGDLRPLPEGFYDPSDRIYTVNSMTSSDLATTSNSLSTSGTARKYHPGSHLIENQQGLILKGSPPNGRSASSNHYPGTPNILGDPDADHDAGEGGLGSSSSPPPTFISMPLPREKLSHGGPSGDKYSINSGAVENEEFYQCESRGESSERRVVQQEIQQMTVQSSLPPLSNNSMGFANDEPEEFDPNKPSPRGWEPRDRQSRAQRTVVL